MKYIKKHLKIISIIIIVILTIFFISLKLYLKNQSNVIEKPSQPQNEILKEELEIDKEEKEETKLVYVDIKGAVKHPSVYEIESDKKVIDVVNKAGGLTNNADTSMINLAKQVTNEMVIIIYTKEEVKKYQNKDEIVKIIDKECICPKINNDACINNNSNDKEVSSNVNKETTTKEDITSKEKINLNTATLEELQTISGIGESKAQAIIEYRKEHIKFNSIEEIKEVTGIGEALYEKIKNNITV